MTDEDELDTVVPVTKTVTVAGTDVQISSIRMGKLPALVRAVRDIWPLFDVDELDYMQLLAEGGDQLLETVSIASGQPRAVVDDLDAAEMVRLTAAVVGVNADFFSQALGPEIEKATVALEKLRGGLSSSASSPTDTDTPTS